MAWDILDRVETANYGPPPRGIIINSRGCGGKIRFMSISVGFALAKDLQWTGAKVAVRLEVGKGDDQGSIAISADAGGKWCATRGKRGDYVFAINSPSAVGKFNLDCPRLSIYNVKVERLPGVFRAIVVVPPEVFAAPVQKAQAA